MAGRKHEVEPEVDSLSFIDFEDDDYRDEVGLDLTTKDAENWYVEAALAFLGEAGVVEHQHQRAEDDRLHEEYQCRGELFWDWVIDQALAAGFDVYDSDTRTELYPGGTRCNEVCPADCVGEDLHQEHISGGHGDTRRGDCPLCEEAFGASSTPISAVQAFELPGSGRFVAEALPNGFIRVDSRASGSSGLWERSSLVPVSGDLSRSIDEPFIRRHLAQLFPLPLPKEAWNSHI
jgi:hypothetical protein